MGRPRLSATLSPPLAALACATALLVTACGHDGASRDGRPAPRPARLALTLPTDSGGLAAELDTESGEVAVRDLEGRMRRLPLDAQGNVVTGAAAARAGGRAPAPGHMAALSAQQRIEADFATLERPALPERAENGDLPDPKVFLGARVVELDPGGAGRDPDAPPMRPGQAMRLVESTVNLKLGVDVDTAFAYATCALAGWAEEHGVPYARHIRTLQQRVVGRLLVASAFAVSQRPPMGLSVVEVGPTLAECKARGIPAT